MVFSKLNECLANDTVPVTKFVSKECGMTVVIAQVPGPIVAGYFTLATEAFDHDGLPHTLEHLIFIGSEEYPYKGILDLTANRNLASGSNAHTDTDHTYYTLKTAGSEGFLNIMPVYLDHILYPTLTDEAFTTEVYHITGEGKDSGVVYCEMQGCETNGDNKVHFAMLEAAYPGVCGYKSNTGGLMKNLRESTTNQKVRDYHKAYYRPENLSLIIVGQVEPNEVLSALEMFEKKIISKGVSSIPYVRPWQSTVPPLLKSIDTVVPYPADEEDNGIVALAWRGPSSVTQIYELAACSVLLRYLTESSISPFQKEFVEVVNPVASNIQCSMLENSESLLYIWFENVPVDKLSEVKQRVGAKLAEIVASDEPFNMKRLLSVINRQKLETLLNNETQPYDAIAFRLIADFLYGNNIQDLEQRLNPVKDLEKMSKEPQSYWVGLLKKYLINAPSITVRGKPSLSEKSRIAFEEEVRINDQVEALGAEGLKRKGEELTLANLTNERAVPGELWAVKPVPDPGRVQFHNVRTYCTDAPPTQPAIAINDLPIFAHLDDVNTNFVYLTVLLDTQAVPDNLRMYLPLLMDSLLELPVMRAGVLVPHEEVVAQLEEDTIATSTSLGLTDAGHFSCSPFGHTACIRIQVEPSKYEIGVRWLHEFLYCVKFTAERLIIGAAKMVNEVAEFRRKGSKIARDIVLDMTFQQGNNNYSINNMVRQQKFLSKIGKELMAGGTSAIGDIEKLLAILSDPPNVVVRIAADIKALSSQVPDISAPWRQFLPSHCTPCRKRLDVTADSKFLRNDKLDKTASVMALGSVESSYMTLTAPGISDYNSEDLAPLMLFMQYLTQLEGPMWKQIRGLGFSYSYNMYSRPSEALIYFTLYKSTNLVSALLEAKTILEAHLQEDTVLDPLLIDSGKSSLMFEVIENEDTIANVIKHSIASYFKGVDLCYNRNLIHKISQVTPSDLKRIGRKYLLQLFDPNVAKVGITCHPNRSAEIGAEFQKLGFNVESPKTLNEIFLR